MLACCLQSGGATYYKDAILQNLQIGFAHGSGGLRQDSMYVRGFCMQHALDEFFLLCSRHTCECAEFAKQDMRMTARCENSSRNFGSLSLLCTVFPNAILFAQCRRAVSVNVLSLARKLSGRRRGK